MRRSKWKSNPHIPGARQRSRERIVNGVAHGPIDVEVPCTDGKYHPYVNAGIPEHCPPSPPYAACPQCGEARASLIGTKDELCDDCRWTNCVAEMEQYAAREGITV